MVHQGINQCAVRRTRCRVDNHARGFVNHNQVIIFIDHIQRNILWQDVAFFGLWHVDFDICTLKNLSLGVKNDNAVHFHRAIRDQTGQTGARQRCILWHITCNRLIKT